MNTKMTYGEPMPLVYTRDSNPRQKTASSRTKAELNDKLDSLIAKLERLTATVRRSNAAEPGPLCPASMAVQTSDAFRLYEQRCAASQAAYDARNPHKHE